MILKQTADTSEEVGFQTCLFVCPLYCYSSFFVLLRLLVYCAVYQFFLPFSSPFTHGGRHHTMDRQVFIRYLNISIMQLHTTHYTKRTLGVVFIILRPIVSIDLVISSSLWILLCHPSLISKSFSSFLQFFLQDSYIMLQWYQKCILNWYFQGVCRSLKSLNLSC